MGKFTNSFSSQDYQIIRRAVIALEKKHDTGDLRGNIIAVANQLHPGRLPLGKPIYRRVRTNS
jgi:hypothetical protein